MVEYGVLDLIGSTAPDRKYRSSALNSAWRAAEGRYPIHRTIAHHIPLEDVEHGLKFIQEHPEEAIKVVIDI